MDAPRRVLAVAREPKARAGKTDASRALRDAQRAYIEMVAKRTGLSYSEIGRRSHLSHSTITRFMNSGDKAGTLATLTISQIADATGVPATALAAGVESVSEGEAEPYISGDTNNRFEQAIKVLTGGRNGADPWLLRTNALEDAGYQPGDVVIVDLNAVPVAGDAVCAQVYDWDKMRAETVFRIFDEPYLVAASRDARLRKPMVVDGKGVVIKGVVTDLIRPRRGNAAAA